MITAVVVKEQGAPSGEPLATPGISVQSASLERKTDALPRARVPGPEVAVQSEPPVAAATAPSFAPTLKLSDEKIAALVARGRQLIFAGDIPNARLVLQQAAEAGNATAALELGATYDPIELEKLDARIVTSVKPVARTLPSGAVSVGNIERKALPDIAMARTWYQKAKDLGSTEALGRLENLAGRDRPKRDGAD